VELERVVGLRVDVDADDLEPGAVVAHGGPSGVAEEIEEAWAAHGDMVRAVWDIATPVLSMPPGWVVGVLAQLVARGVGMSPHSLPM
jgi:hypothetical protein